MTPANTIRKTKDHVLVEVGFVNEKQTEQLKKKAGEGFIELSDTASLKKLGDKVSLGVVRAMGDQCAASLNDTFLNDIIDQKAVVTIPITEQGIYIKEEVANDGNKIISIEGDYGDRIGFQQSLAKVTANFTPRQGDILVNDKYYGDSLMVAMHEEPVPNGDGGSTFYVHLTNQAFEKYVSKSEWEDTYVTIDNNFRAELGTNASGINFGQGAKMIEKFFRIGNHQTADVVYSDEAGMVMVQEMGKGYLADQSMLSSKINSLKGMNLAITSKDVSGAISVVTIDAIKYALFEKAWQMASNQAFSFQGIDFTGSNGNIYAPKGVWKQIQDHSPKFNYTNDSNFVLQLKFMSDKLYGMVPDVDRELELEGGMEFGNTLRRIFAREFPIATQNVILDQSALPGKIITGTLDNMELHAMRVSKAHLHGIGRVSFKHNPSFDYTSKNPQFLSTGNLSRSTHSAIIRDVKATYDKAMVKKAGLYDKLMFGDEYTGSNFVMVKQAGKPMISFGVQQGSSHMGGVASSNEWQHRQFVSVDKFGVLVVDPSRVFLMEKEFAD